MQAYGTTGTDTMSAERFKKYDEALEREGFDGYMSVSDADVLYLTGSEKAKGVVLVYGPGRTPILVIREAAAPAARDTASGEVRSFTLEEGPIDAMVKAIRDLGIRRMAVGSYGTDQELMMIADTPSTPVDRALADALPDVQWELRPFLGPTLRRVKEPAEIDALRRSAECIGAGYDALFAMIKPGVTDLAAAAAATGGARIHGANFVRYLLLMGGTRTAYCEGMPTGRPFEDNELGLVDMDIVRDHYYADCTRPFVIGDPPDEAQRIVEAVDGVQREVLDMVRPGVGCADLYYETRRMFAEAGYPDSTPHYLGHGIGVAGDRWPILMPGSEEVIMEGETLCIEPAVYVPGVGGARMEDMILVGAQGNEVITSGIERVPHLPR